MITATVTAWANELGKDPDTIRRAMSKSGIALPGAREKVRASVVLKLLVPDFENPKQRLLAAQAEAQERENAEAEARLVEWDRIERYVMQRLVLPTIAALDAAEGLTAEWVEKTLKPLLRQKLGAPKA